MSAIASLSLSVFAGLLLARGQEPAVPAPANVPASDSTSAPDSPAMTSPSDRAHPANRLAASTSPYLLQHAHNPVDWYPWGAEALERARSENKPIFLSVGYSACHWCHVMERECFENERIAALMNRWFVNVKVDREERPDIDEIYMKAVQAMSGSGGWPMSVFLTPDLEPFFGGTYFPPVRMHGRPSFPELVENLGRAWSEEPEQVQKRARQAADYLRREAQAETAGEIPDHVLDLSLAALENGYDPRWGGFGDAPKFPHAMDVRALLRHAQRQGDAQLAEHALHTLRRMAQGGMYDQLGGGFHRYSTDEKWLIPHFEKMLYDNALLIPAYLEAYQWTKEPAFATVVRETCAWVLREMTTAEGAFASSQDADSEGEEGKFFAWTPAEIEAVLGAETGALACQWFGVTDDGNFEDGASVLWREQAAQIVAAQAKLEPAELERRMAQARLALFEARSRRVAPQTDDKVLVAWNGLMIGALARASAVLGEQRYRESAQNAARFVLRAMRRDDGTLYATSRHGKAHLDAYLDDYAFLIAGLIDLYEADFDARWLREALALTRVLNERFADREQGGYFTTSNRHERLLVRLKAPHDGALPAGVAVQALNLLRLTELTGSRELGERAQKDLLSVGKLLSRYPQAFSQHVIALDFLRMEPREIVLAGERGSAQLEAMLRALHADFDPRRVVAMVTPNADLELLPLLEGKQAPAGGARAWICQGWACQAPVDSPQDLARALAAPRESR